MTNEYDRGYIDCLQMLLARYEEEARLNDGAPYGYAINEVVSDLMIDIENMENKEEGTLVYKYGDNAIVFRPYEPMGE